MQAAELFTFATDWLTANVSSMVIALIVFIVGWTAAKFVSHWIRNNLSKARGVDKTVAPVLAQVARYAILIFTLMAALAQLGVQTTSMLAVLGAAGLAVALGLQGVLTNIAAGLMIIGLRPMSVGDFVSGQGGSGTVTEIGLFGTRLRTADGLYVFVPNSQIWGSAITNYSRNTKRRFDLKVGISYDSDMAKARTAMLKLAKADKRVLSNPDPIVYVDELGDSAVVMLLRIWVKTSDYWDVRFELIEKTKLAFDKAGIEIPYNKLDVNLLNALPEPEEVTTK